MKKLNSKKGFTLMEMLIVVAIIAILVAIAIPTMSTSLESARKAADQANVRSAYAEASSDYLTSTSSIQGKTYTSGGVTCTADVASGGTITINVTSGITAKQAANQIKSYSNGTFTYESQ